MRVSPIASIHIYNPQGKEIHHNDANGFLCLKKPLPGMGRKLTGEKPEEKFRTTYFQQYPGKIIHCKKI